MDRDLRCGEFILCRDEEALSEFWVACQDRRDGGVSRTMWRKQTTTNVSEREEQAKKFMRRVGTSSFPGHLEAYGPASTMLLVNTFSGGSYTPGLIDGGVKQY